MPGDLCEHQTHGGSNNASSMAPAFGTITLCGTSGDVSKDGKTVSPSYSNYRPPSICQFHHDEIQRISHETQAPETPISAPSNPSRRLTAEKRKIIFELHNNNPCLKHTVTAKLLGLHQSTISRVLIQKKDGLFKDDGSRSPWKRPKYKSPDIDRALSNWVKNRQQQGLSLSDAIIENKANFFAETVRNSEIHLEANSNSWLEKFKEKNYHTGARRRKVAIAQDSEGTSNLLSNIITDTTPKISLARPTSLTSLSSPFFTPENTVASDVHSTPAIRACDNCRKKKIKCVIEGDKVCNNCHQRDIECTYNAVPRKRGPRGSRAKVPPEHCTTQHKVQPAAKSPTDLGSDERSLPLPFARVQVPPGHCRTQHKVQPAAESPTDLGSDGCSLPLTSARTSGLLSSTLVKSCIDYFFSHVYPLEPVLHRPRAEKAVADMGCSLEAYCMIAALCAFVMIQANHEPPVSVLPRPEMANKSNVEVGQVLLEESIRVRQGSEYQNNPSNLTVLTSWFYSGCYFGLAEEETAWTYLREATTQAQLLAMDDEKNYKGDPLDVSHIRMLYWVLFIAERTYALRNKRPTSLSATIYPPSFDKVASVRPIVVGIEIMIDIIKIIDDNFIKLWNGVENTDIIAARITQAQDQLSMAVPEHLACTDSQMIQIHIVKLWLNLKFWQKRQQKGLLDESGAVRKGRFSLLHPLEIATGALSLSRLFDQQDTIILCQGLIEKLCDIADCVVDTIQTWPAIRKSIRIKWLLKFWHFMRRLIPMDNKRQNTLEEIGKVVAQYHSNRLPNRACGIQNDDGHSPTPCCNQLCAGKDRTLLEIVSERYSRSSKVRTGSEER